MTAGPPPPVRVLVGGTASGKKGLAAELFRRHGVALLSMDSMKVYRGMDIGTDKPDAALRARAPFALLDLVGHDAAFSAGDWLRAAQSVVAARDEPPLFAGGTPFYLRLLLRGLCPSPPVDWTLRAELAALWDEAGEAEIRRRLRVLDAPAEARLAVGDGKRLLRALEVAQLTGRPLTEWQREHTRRPLPGRGLVVALRHAPAAHERRIASRVQRMLSAGLLDEVRGLLARAPFAVEPARSIGYAEALAHLRGELPADELLPRIVLRTRQLVRKQRLHLQQFEEVQWVEVGDDEPVEALATRVARALELG